MARTIFMKVVVPTTEVNGNVQVYWKGTKPNARVLLIPAQEPYWQAVVETRRSGFGKARLLYHFPLIPILITCVKTVHPDADFECLGVMMEHNQDVKCVAWHPTEEILASASYDDTIKLYIDDPSEDWFCFETLKGHTSTVWSVCFAPSGNYIASASDDRTVRIWKRMSEHKWECVSVLEGHERSVYSVSWGLGKNGIDGGLGRIASTGSDGTVNVWDLSVRIFRSCLSDFPAFSIQHHLNYFIV